MLCLDVIFGSPIMPDLLGIIAGHLYYFLTVLHPLATGKILLKTPNWMYPFSWGLLGWIGHFKSSFAALVVGEYSTAALCSILVLAERSKVKT